VGGIEAKLNIDKTSFTGNDQLFRGDGGLWSETAGNKSATDT
jgi:hypothetical protein